MTTPSAYLQLRGQDAGHWPAQPCKLFFSTADTPDKPSGGAGESAQDSQAWLSHLFRLPMFSTEGYGDLLLTLKKNRR